MKADVLPPSVKTVAIAIPGLELLRGLACLTVLCWHTFWSLMVNEEGRMSPFLVPFSFSNFGREAVIIFFLLSGYVIALSQERKHRTFGTFIWARLRRLLPLYLVAVAFSLACDALLKSPAPFFTVIGHLLFLQHAYSIWMPFFFTNPALWSLSYEFYFYLIYAITIGREQARWRTVWLVLGLIGICLSMVHLQASGLWGHFQSILAISPVWLLGVFLVSRPLWPGLGLAQASMVFGMIPMASFVLGFSGPTIDDIGPLPWLLVAILAAPLFYSVARTEDWSHNMGSIKAWLGVFVLDLILTDYYALNAGWERRHVANALCMAFPFVCFFVFLVGYFFFARRIFFTPKIIWLSLLLGRMSYAVYIIHHPVIFLTVHYLPNLYWRAAVDILVPIALGALLEFGLQQKATAWFDRLWP